MAKKQQKKQKSKGPERRLWTRQCMQRECLCIHGR
jgi:hypothetical protein